MCGKASCLGSNQLHSAIYSRAFSDFHFLLRQNSLCLRTCLNNTLADAPGLSWDCHYQPWLVEGWQSREAGRSWAIGSPYRGQSVAFFTSSL